MIELIAVTPDEARVAELAGADRIELVSALSEGGLTPGIGLVRKTVTAVRIPVNVMVRPHSRGFVYSQADLAVMREEIRAIRAAGANGVVFGALDEEGRVELRVLEALLGCAEGLEVTFHRAIDASRDPVASARTLSGYPIRTILTSGGGRSHRGTRRRAPPDAGGRGPRPHHGRRRAYPGQRPRPVAGRRAAGRPLRHRRSEGKRRGRRHRPGAGPGTGEAA